MDELVARCSPRWETMTALQKSNFKETGRSRFEDDVEIGGRDCFGRSKSGQAKIKREEELKLEEMKHEIKNIVELATCHQKLEEKVFCVLSTSVFCFTEEKEVVPAELSLARISLKEGIIDVYQVFIEPGTIPKGYRSDCMANSAATHKIPLDFNLFVGDYNKILEDILEMMLKDDTEDGLPPLYCMPKLFSQNKLVLNWLIKKSRTTLIEEDEFRLHSLPILLFEMTRENNKSLDSSFTTLSSMSLIKNRVPTLAIAEAQLERDTFMYMPGMCCDWHQEIETIHCTKASVMGLSYILFSLVCPLYALPMASISHMPVGEETSLSIGDFRSSLASCGLSTVSGDNLSVRSGSYVEKSRKELPQVEMFGDKVQSSVDFSSDQSFI